MTRPLPQIHEGRDGVREMIKLVNEMRRYYYRAPGIAIAPADETIAAFSCVTFSEDTGNVILARADSTNYATGVLVDAVNVGELALVVSLGIITDAVLGRAANDPVWVGPAGTLVFVAPGVGNYVQPIASCVNATDIFVSVSIPVI